MVLANTGLVIEIATTFAGRGASIDDLIGEGYLGLIRAADKFDPRFGTRFRTYAAPCIKEAIRSALMNATPTIRLPRYMIRLLTTWMRAERSSAREFGRSCDFDEIASRIGLSKMQRDLVAKARRARQLMLETDLRGPMGSWLSDETEDQPSAEAVLEAEEERAVIRRSMGCLEARERAVLMLRYGLEGEGLSSAEIGRRLGRSREWVRQTELRCLRKLRADLSDPSASLKIRIMSPRSGRRLSAQKARGGVPR
jgi:RNA polymerase sigma factor (sigma-70 family)